MGAMASQITSFTIVYSTVYSDANQRKHQSSSSLVFVRGNHRGPLNSPHKWPVTRKMFPFDDVIMNSVDTSCAPQRLHSAEQTKSKQRSGYIYDMMSRPPLNYLLWGWLMVVRWQRCWFEKHVRSLWRHCNDTEPGHERLGTGGTDVISNYNIGIPGELALNHYI